MEYVIYLFVAFLITNLGLGLYYGRSVKNLREYAVGEQNFSIFIIAATIVATWIGGGGFVIILSRVYEKGIGWVFTLFGSIAAILLVSQFALRMGEFRNHLSIASAMGSMYGKNVRLATAVFSLIRSTIFAALQFKVGAKIISVLFGVQPGVATCCVAAVIIAYSAFGGIRSVMVTDLFQLTTFGLFLPLLIYSLCFKTSGAAVSSVLNGPLFSFQDLLGNPDRWQESLFFTLFFIIPTFSPPFYQRCVLAPPTQSRKAHRLAALVYAFIVFSIALVAVLLLALNPQMDSKNLLRHIISVCDTPYHRGLVLVGLTALVMASADSHLNAMAVIFSNDLLRLSKSRFAGSLAAARCFSLVTGTIALLLALFFDSSITMQLVSRLLYPIVITFLLAVFGFRTSNRAVLTGMASYIIVGLVSFFMFGNIPAKMIVLGMLVNLLTLFVVHYGLGEPGGWVGIKDKAPLTAHTQLQQRRWAGRWETIRNFNLDRYLQDNLPKKEVHYLLFGFYVLTFVFGSIFFLPREAMQTAGFGWLLGSFLLVNALMITCPIWPREVKKKAIIAPLWAFGVGYILFYIGEMFILLSGFHMVHVALLIVNLTLGMLLLRRKLVVSGIILGGLMALLTCHFMGHTIVFAEANPAQLFFVLLITVAGLWVVCDSEQNKRRLERRHRTLSSLQRSTEDTLTALRWAPEHFAQKLIETNHAGMASAYTMSKEMLGEEHALTQKIDMSAQYLTKTLQLIQTQTQLQTRQYPLWKFLNRLYERHPGLDEAGLILYNRAQTKTIKWDIDKVHQLIYKTYRYLKPHHPKVQYSYLHVQDTTLKYPGRQKPVRALAFAFTFATRRPRIASCYIHIEQVKDPHLVGNRKLREIQTLVDKHYGHLDLTNAPREALIVLPMHLDKIRPKAIEDQPAPNKTLQNELLREAKFIEGDFWTIITQQPHYNIPKIEQVVNFMKATHQHQTRKDNTPYYVHPLIVAKYVTAYDARPHMLIAALLHDIVEDTHVTLEEVRIRFGHEVAQLVKLLSNINLDTFKKYKKTNKEAHAAQIAQNRDAILIKTCDRIHNLETLNAMPRPKQQAKAKETLKHYVPIVKAAGFADLANRLKEMAKKFL